MSAPQWMADQPLRARGALVTGSGRGLGMAIVQTLGQLGAACAIHDLSDSSPAQYGESATLNASVHQLKSLGRQVTAVTGDVTSEGAVERMVSEAQAEL